MTLKEHARFMRCYDVITAFKLFRDAGNKLTDDDLEFMRKVSVFMDKKVKITDEARERGCAYCNDACCPALD